jgi:hypothetical protein
MMFIFVMAATTTGAQCTTYNRLRGNDMTRTEVVIRWLAEDIQQLRPDWSLDDCEAVLEKFGRALTDRSIEVGWEILEVLLGMEDDERTVKIDE